jgi:hypothetical protein
MAAAWIERDGDDLVVTLRAPLTSVLWAAHGSPTEVFDALQAAIPDEMAGEPHAEIVRRYLDPYMVGWLPGGNQSLFPTGEGAQEALAEGWIERVGTESDVHRVTKKGRARLARLRVGGPSECDPRLHAK